MFKNLFVTYVCEKREEMLIPDATALLVFYRHNSHISLRVIKAAVENNIDIIKFLSHLTDQIQPLDKCVFDPFKKVLDIKLVEFGKTNIGVGIGRVQKHNVVKLSGEVWEESMTKANILAGFVTTGIYHVDRSRFPTTNFDSSKLAAY